MAECRRAPLARPLSPGDAAKRRPGLGCKGRVAAAILSAAFARQEFPRGTRHLVRSHQQSKQHFSLSVHLRLNPMLRACFERFVQFYRTARYGAGDEL